MRHLFFGAVLGLGLINSPLSAQELSPSPLSGVIKADGLAAGLDFAARQPEGDRKKFALGALNALQAIEHILQVRYNNYTGRLPFVPGGSTPLRMNPDAKFNPAFIEDALDGAAHKLATAQGHLESLGDDEFALVINLDDIWFDVDSDGIRAADEGLRYFLGAVLSEGAPAQQLPIVQFDRADGRWLLAYTHVLQGMAEMVLSVDPTPAVTKVTQGVARMRELGKVRRDPIFGDDNVIDTIAVIIAALHGPADQARTQQALGHFQAMIAANKEFWRLVALEEDDQAEWLPNANQHSAFGVSVSEEMALGWQDVLNELEAVFAGEALVPFWRVEGRGDEQVGINIHKLLTAPGDLDLILMVQGTAFASYLEKGRLVDLYVLERFSELAGGQGGLFALWLN